jgi:hypothetical protein
MKGARFVDTFGEFRKFSSSFESDEDEDNAEFIKCDLAEGSPCPDCSQPLFEVHLNERQYIEFLERLETAPTPSPPGKARQVQH